MKDVRKTFSPETTGLLDPFPGNLVFQATFSVSLQVVGIPVPAVPDADWPRNRVQSSADTAEAIHRQLAPQTQTFLRQVKYDRMILIAISFLRVVEVSILTVLTDRDWMKSPSKATLKATIAASRSL